MFKPKGKKDSVIMTEYDTNNYPAIMMTRGAAAVE